jgi:hypothetical protein
MTRTTLAAGLAAIPLALALGQAVPTIRPASALVSGYSSLDRSSVEQRFAVRFCFSQYNTESG